MKQLALLNLVLRCSGLLLLLVGLMGLREWSGETPGWLFQLTGDLQAVRGISIACLLVGALDLYLPGKLTAIYQRSRQRDDLPD